jgi:hypothetical protein
MQFDAENQALAQAEQEQALSLQQQQRDLNQGYETQQRSTLNNNASGGTAFSSAYGVGVNDDSRNYNNMNNDLLAQDGLFRSGIAGQRTAAQNRLDTLLQRAYAGYADSLAGDAGNLGLGGDTPAAASASAPGQQHATYNPNLTWNDVAPGSVKNDNKDGKGSGVGPGRPPKPGPNYVWRDGRWKKDK